MTILILGSPAGCADDEQPAGRERPPSTAAAPHDLAARVADAMPVDGSVRFTLQLVIAGETLSTGDGEIDLTNRTGHRIDIVSTPTGERRLEIRLVDGRTTERDPSTGQTRVVAGDNVVDLIEMPAVADADDAPNLRTAVQRLLGDFTFVEHTDAGDGPKGSSRYSADGLDIWVDGRGRLARFEYASANPEGIRGIQVVEFTFG